MVKQLLFLIALCTLALFFIGCTQSVPPAQNQTPVETPAYLKCIGAGGGDKIVSGPTGNMELCLFKDGTVCEQSKFYDNTCKEGDCLRHCGAIGTRSEGWYDCNNKLLFYDNCKNETAQQAGTC